MNAQPATNQFILFSLADREFALSIAQVVQVLRMVALTPLPTAPEWLPGVINLRGQVIPVIDLRTRLGLPPRPLDLSTRILIVQVNERRCGLIADAVKQVATIPPAQLDRAEGLGSASDFITAIARVQEQLVMILDLARLSAGAERLTARAEVVS